MNYTIGTYIIYLALSTALTIWVAKTLYQNGRAFLIDSFHGNKELADSINHLLVVGFYLVNLGYIAMRLKNQAQADDLQQLIEAVCAKVGFVMLFLGVFHFLNLFVFNQIRRQAIEAKNRLAPPPLTAR